MSAKIDDEYEPDSLSCLQRRSQRFLSDGKSPFNFLVDKEFEMSLKVLAAKREREQAKPHPPTHVVTDGGDDEGSELPILRPSRESCGGFVPPLR